MKLQRVLWLAALLACSFNLFAQEDQHHHHDMGELGTVSFPISCARNSQAPFELGMALLYSFEYEQARQQFESVAKTDPQCAMAYWGQAMSLYHQLWSRPTPNQLSEGWNLIEKARALKPATQRERDYIDALAVFYRDAGSVSHEKRAEEYATAMGRLSATYPEDHEAAVLYALSLLALDNRNDPTLANAKKAVGILNALLVSEPNHPGVAHYIIHACDNPKMASMGLAAARHYAEIAPASAHATHMPSHIFARLGLWQDDIHSNLAALADTDKDAAMGMNMAHHRLHSIDFLEYAYLQIGDDANANAMADRVRDFHRNDLEEDLRFYYDYSAAHLPAMYVAETHRWKDALALRSPDGLAPYGQAITDWAHAVAAGHLQDAASAQAALAHFNAMLEEVRKSSRPYQANDMATNQEEATAWTEFAQGKSEDALRRLRGVADHQDAVGKGEVELPAREMVGDMLTQLNRPQEALAEYERSLQSDPNRFNGLYGAARAAELANQPKKAADYDAQLLKNCKGVNSDRPELKQARMQVAATAKTAYSPTPRQ